MSTDPYSKEVRQLLTTHLEHLTKSAISIEVIKERGYISVMGKTPLKDVGFSKTQSRTPGILMPLHGVDGTIVGHQYRPDTPRTNSKWRPIKYENPLKSSVRIDMPPRCLAMIGDPHASIFITEGIKKVDALASAGACAIGLTGVWGFKGKNDLGGTAVLADFHYITWKDRLVYLVFDSDSSTNPQVGLALKILSEILSRKGAKVRILQLPAGPDGEKVGADDYLAQGHTLQDLIGLELIDEQTVKQTLKERSAEQYLIEDGRICWNKQTPKGRVVTPRGKSTAHNTSEILREDGEDKQSV